MSAAKIAEQLGGIHPSTLYRLKKQYPGAAPPNFEQDQLEKWKRFVKIYAIGCSLGIPRIPAVHKRLPLH